MIRKKEIWMLLVLILVLCLWAFWPKAAGASVYVTVDGETVGEYSLLQEAVVPIVGYGDFSLTLIVRGGQAHVEDSSCPDLICQHHAPISRAGEQIVCLPGRVVISVTGEEGDYDAVIG